VIHHYINDDGDGFAVSPNADRNKVLVQLQWEGEQVRVALDREQTKHLVTLLLESFLALETNE